jgi:thioredoxin reductase
LALRTERPFAPGEYGVVVVGSGPGGLQVSYDLRRLGVDHAVIAADDAPGGMFRRFPLFERLISWTHQSAEAPRASREYEGHDQNSLVAEEPRLRALVAAAMSAQRRQPAREEMEAGLVAFAERAPIAIRYGCRWEATRFEDDRIVLATSDGEYRSRAVVLAVGMTEPWVPDIPGLELAQHYVAVNDDRGRYTDQRVLIVGKRNSAFEVGDGLLRLGVRELTLVSPRPADVSRLARSPLRPWYLTPYDEHVRGAPGRYVLDASVERVERYDGGFRVHAMHAATGETLLLEADLVIAATGFRAPLQDLPAHGLATVLDGRLPALTPYWESMTVPNVFFAGNVTQAAQGLRKHGVASLSSMVCGFRYNARLLAGHIAERLYGVAPPRPRLRREDVVPYLLRELTRAPELAMQKGYLARALTVEPAGAIRDDGIVPLEVFVDGEEDGVAATLEFDGTETIRPVLYVRHRGALREVLLPSHPLRRYESAAYDDAVETELRHLIL